MTSNVQKTDNPNKAEALAARKNLKSSYLIYILAWGLGLPLFIIGIQNDIRALFVLGGLFFYGSIIPYIICLVFSYRVQSKMHEMGLSKSGGTSVVIGGLLLNPLVLGFYIPLSVLIASKKLKNV